ncbi:MAG: hypothetical protein RQ723_07530 [Desulfuromonadales bacterium]|nr:hypothetical protein [Desulfuromonadales bacterium]
MSYDCIAYDAWAEQTLAELRQYLPPGATVGRPTRTLHLRRIEPTRAAEATVAAGLTADQPQAVWYRQKNPVNTVWQSPQTSDVLWTDGIAGEIGCFHYHLPWNVIIDDMILHGGLPVHGALAVHAGQGLLFVAPPGGGKTTTMATAPAGWDVLSDDAALIWPDRTNHWSASPLPSWTELVSADRTPRTDPGRTCRLQGLVLLNKADRVDLRRVAPVKAVPALYRAVGEYPVLVMTEVDCRSHAFGLACRLARTLPCWQLDLPRGGDIWSRLEAVVTG